MISKNPTRRQPRLDTEHNTASVVVLRQRARAVRKAWTPQESESRKVPEIHAMIDFLRMLTYLPGE
ncbi:MAG: hypothetical protein KDA90_18490 [Planctomycetaceae bacterium]|nr:hypothetical protein [Planctomycetaceae bacterium]